MRNVKKQMEDWKVIFPLIEILQDDGENKDSKVPKRSLKNLKGVGNTIGFTNRRISNYNDRINYMYN